MQGVSFDKIYKLPPKRRYFNVSVLWIFYYPYLVRLLYRLRVRHEAVTLTSLAFGLAGGLFILRPGYGNLLAAAICVHLKDLFDASDGSLARLQGTTNRIARFLDSLSDALAITWLLAALALRFYSEVGPAVIAEAAAAWLSIFLQCSYFNYYLVAYTRLVSETNVRLDERMTEEDRRLYAEATKRFLLAAFQRAYAAVYGWQDKLIAAVDRIALRRAWGLRPEELSPEQREAWYGDKRLLTLNSPLCFGTHLFILVLCLLLARPRLFYYIVIFAMNPFLALNITCRQVLEAGLLPQRGERSSRGEGVR